MPIFSKRVKNYGGIFVITIAKLDSKRAKGITAACKIRFYVSVLSHFLPKEMCVSPPPIE
jgi:hypothetical protein